MMPGEARSPATPAPVAPGGSASAGGSPAPAPPGFLAAGPGGGGAAVHSSRIRPRWLVVGPYLVPGPPYLFVRDIRRAVEAHYGLAPGDTVSPRRDRAVARPRQVVMYLARRLGGQTLAEIGRRLGGRHHTTVLDGVRAIASLRLADPLLDADIRSVAAALGAPAPL